MAIDDITVRNIASLARINVTNEEVSVLSKELDSIFEWIEELKNVDVTDVEPLSNVAEISLRERDDTIVSDNSIEETLRNVPEKHLNYFSVPKVIE